MNNSTQSSGASAARGLFLALELLRDKATEELGPREAGRLFTLMRELMFLLPAQDLTAADVSGIQTAGKAMLAVGHSRKEMRLVQKGLTALYDLACTRGLVERNPVRGSGRAKDGPRTATLVVTEREALAERIREVLGPAPGEVEVEASAANAVEMVRWYPFRHLVCWYPMPAPGVERLLREVRGNRSPTRTAGLVLVIRPDGIEEASIYLGNGANRVLTEDAVGDLREVLQGLGDAEQRVELKLPLRVVAASARHSGVALWQLEDISITGMLIRTRTVPEMGSLFGCELTLPGDLRPISCHAQVVRKAAQQRESVVGIGARFVDFEADGRSRLSSFLTKQLGS